MLSFKAWEFEYENDEWVEQEFDPYQFGPYFSRISAGDKDFVLSQFTGMMDWRGHEIYEGDVLFIYYHPEARLTNEYYLVESVKDFLIHYGKIEGLVRKISNDGSIYERPSLMERITQEK